MLEVLGNGQQIRDFTFVTDTVQGLLLLAEGGLMAGAYNLSSGCSVSVTQVAQLLIAALGLAGQTRITYTGSSWLGDAQRWVVSIEKSGRLGYIPTVDLENGCVRPV